MRLVRHSITRNWFAWKEGICTLDIQFRGTKEELMLKLKEEIEKDLAKNA
jgi:hypothetical protein